MRKLLEHARKACRPERFTLLVGTAVILLTSGCATTPKPTDKLALATTAIARAEQAGALDSAPVNLAAARDKLAKAQQAVQSTGGFIAAGRFAEEAEVDAQLAEATARESKAQNASAELDKSLEALRHETHSTAQ